MPDSTLHIYFNEPDPEPNTRNCFVISEEIKDGDSKSNTLFTELANLDVTSDSQVSYETFWPHLVLPSRGNLLSYVKLYNSLESELNNENYSRIVTHSLERGYQLVVSDVCNFYSLHIEHNSDTQIDSSRNILLLSVFVFFLDQIIALLIGMGSSIKKCTQADVLVFPYPGRFESTLPVINQLEDSDVVVSPLLVAWRFLGADKEWPDDVPVCTLSEYTSLRAISGQLKILGKLQISILKNDLSLANSITMQLAVQFGVHLPRTIQFVCYRTVKRDIRSILSFGLLERAIKESESSSVVVGGQHVRDRHVLKKAHREGKDTFYVPHSVVYKNEILPPSTETTHFMAGKADKHLLCEMYSEECLPRLVCSGRPFLDKMHKHVQKQEINSRNRSRIIIGTQPYPDWIRKEFVLGVLRQIEQSSYDGEVLIKIHPSESTDYYSDLLQIQGYDYPVCEGPIEEFVTISSCLITINSNVGIESILLGAYCVSFNIWSPFVSPTSYIDGETIPQLTDEQEVGEFLDGIKTHIQRRQPAQLEYILKSYSIGESSKKIAKVVGQNSGG